MIGQSLGSTKSLDLVSDGDLQLGQIPLLKYTWLKALTNLGISVPIDLFDCEDLIYMTEIETLLLKTQNNMEKAKVKHGKKK